MPQPLGKGPETKLPLPRLRPDLIASEQKQEGRTFFVLKDPISLQYLRLARHEHFIVRCLDGKRNLDDVAKLLQENFAEAEFDADRAPQEVLQFLQQLSDKNFLLLPAESAVETVLQRKRDKWKLAVQKFRRNLFFFRIPVFDPDKLFARMHPPLRWIWTKWFMAFSALLFLSAVVLVVSDFDRLAYESSQFDFFNLYNMYWFWVAFIGVKIIHEFGHGLTVKNYGGECHELGFLFIVFTPAFYCDTTDAWMMPKRGHRILISSAGIYVELIIAALAAFVWYFTEPGLLHQLTGIVMFLCSFSTVVFNANPLLKFDGYYMLSDAIETPNLQQKSYAYVMMLLRRWLFGERPESAQFSQTPLPQKYRGFFATYSIVSYFYRWFILFGIFLFLSELLAPYGLEHLAKLFALFSVFASMIFPVAMSAYYFFRARATKPDPEPLTRPITVLVLLALAFILSLFIPIPRNITRSCVLKPREDAEVRAVAPGFIEAIHVSDGQIVPKGFELARLRNRELEAAEEQLKWEREAVEIKINAAQAAADGFRKRQFEAERDTIAASLTKIRFDLSTLTLLAPTDGVVVGFRLNEAKGRWLEVGQSFCQVAPVQPFRVIIPLDQREAGIVNREWEARVKNLNSKSKPDLKLESESKVEVEKVKVNLRVYGLATEKFPGEVSRPPLSLKRVVTERGLSASSGGDVPTTQDPQKGVERPSESLYEAELEIQNPEGRLRAGMTGRAKLYCGKTTVAAIVGEHLRAFIKFDLQM